MTLFRREHRADHPTSNLDELYARRRHPHPTAGQHVDSETAMRLSAVFASIDTISSLVSTLPVHEFRDRDNVPEKLPRPPLFPSPDGELELDSWLYQIMDSLLKRGNAYGLILTRDRDGYPTKIKMLHPDLVRVEQNGKLGSVVFKIENREVKKYDSLSGSGELWHIPAYTQAGSPIGMSPIGYAASVIGIGLAAQEFGGNWFRDNATPSVVLTNEAEMGADAANLAKQLWVEKHTNNREPAVLANGWGMETISVNANESQFLETIRATKADIASFYRLDPDMIGAAAPGMGKQYRNVEQQSLKTLVYTLNPWLVKLERALSALRPRPRYMRFNADAILRVDAMTRWKIYEMGVRNGLLSPDECRELEERPAIPDGQGKKWIWPPMRQQLTEPEMAGMVDDEDEIEDEFMPTGPAPVPPALSPNGSGGSDALARE